MYNLSYYHESHAAALCPNAAVTSGSHISYSIEMGNHEEVARKKPEINEKYFIFIVD
jgi:hypothetical protein